MKYNKISAALIIGAIVILGITEQQTRAAIYYLNITTNIQPGNPQEWATNDDLYVGNSGIDGALIIQNAGVVTNSKGYIGTAVNSSGRVLVDGAGSIWICTNELDVGYSSPGAYTGRLEIINGGKVYAWASGGGYIGHYQNATYGPANGYCIVSGADSELYCGPQGGSVKNITIGSAGNGYLTITNGGKVSCNILTLGANATANYNTEGIIAVSGTGSMFTTSQLNLGGAYSKGVITITDGGAVTTGYVRAGAAIGLGGGQTGYGIITVNGTNASLGIGYSGTRSMVVGGYDTTGPLGPGSISLLGGGRITATMEILVYSNSTLSFEIGSIFNPLHCDTSVILSNSVAIAISLASGFAPTPSQPYTLISADTSVVVTNVANLVLNVSTIKGLRATLSRSSDTKALQVTFLPVPAGTIFTIR